MLERVSTSRCTGSRYEMRCEQSALQTALMVAALDTTSARTSLLGLTSISLGWWPFQFTACSCDTFCRSLRGF